MIYEQYCSYVGKIITLSTEHATTSRPKYFGDTFVIKFNETIKGSKYLGQQSTEEIKLWETLDEDREYFVKLIDYSVEGGWVVQERIDIVQNTPTEDQRAIIERLKKKFGLNDILSIVMSNWTIREDGTPIIYDWGTNNIGL